MHQNSIKEMSAKSNEEKRKDEKGILTMYKVMIRKVPLFLSHYLKNDMPIQLNHSTVELEPCHLFILYSIEKGIWEFGWIYFFLLLFSTDWVCA